MPSSWMLQEVAVHNLTTNTAVVSKYMRCDSGKWSIWADKLSRNVSPQIDGSKQRAPDWEGQKFWFAKIRDKSATDLLGALSLKGEKRIAKSPTSKGAIVPKKLKVKKYDKPQRKREIRFSETKICLEVQQEIGRGRISCSVIGDFHLRSS